MRVLQIFSTIMEQTFGSKRAIKTLILSGLEPSPNPHYQSPEESRPSPSLPKKLTRVRNLCSRYDSFSTDSRTVYACTSHVAHSAFFAHYHEQNILHHSAIVQALIIVQGYTFEILVLSCDEYG